MIKLFNSKSVLAFIIFTVMINGYVSVNMMQKNKRNYNSLIEIIKEENKLLTNQLLKI